MKIETVIKALENVVNSAEDEGCDGCYTVSSEVIEAAERLLKRYYKEQG